MSENNLINNKINFRLEETTLALLLILSIIGVAIADFSPANSFVYWLVIVPVFALCAIFIGWRQAKSHSKNVKIILREQSLHWFTSLLIVDGAFLLVKFGRLMPEDAGLVIMLILALATLLDGLRIGWRFSLLGLFVGIAAVSIPYTPNFLWIALLNALVIVIIVILSEVWKAKRAQS